MQLKPGFVFVPLPPIEAPASPVQDKPAMAPLTENLVTPIPIPLPIHDPIPIHPPLLPSPLGPLASLIGAWQPADATKPNGFNTIWRPFFGGGSDHFLELNLTADSTNFDLIPGAIPNRGLLQADMQMFGITYLNQIADFNLKAGLHIEPGIWALVPATTNPAETLSVVRMASIPHGTTIVAQGTTSTAAGAPNIPAINITPFIIGQPTSLIQFPESTLTTASNFRSSGQQMNGIVQSMVDNPNSVLHTALTGQTILSTTTLHVSTNPTAPMVGGGTANTAFLAGNAHGPNAAAVEVEATFWIETVKGSPDFLQLQYSQTVLLNFAGLSWPHVTVGTLKHA